MVAMAGDPTFVECENQVCIHLFGYSTDMSGELRKRLLGQVAIRVVQQLGPQYPEDSGSPGELLCTYRGQITFCCVERRCLTASEAEDGRVGALIDEGRQDPAEAEGLIVRMGTYDQHGPRSRQHRRDHGSLLWIVRS